ncbi:uncharacterized protein LOC124465355 isoform X3 [Hypomesus transpacificus]|uniref:uncharacterized protein LOC124465355 isoform X3 n=1 Tax=Hypomesus transpacificus TaxID=137520 RepID=UPI001F073C4B|nr:uncharacterized protein LOC124465355 isoform X3 [Hypomesus transpacificus]
MSNMRRQTSWQEDIARNFSRLFLRSKSQDHEKTDEEDISPNGQENGVCNLSSGPSDGDPSLLQEHLSKAFRSTEEELYVERLDWREGAEEGVAEEGGQSVSHDAGASSHYQLPIQLPTDSPQEPVSPPTPLPVETSFLQRLSSLFQFRAESRETTQPEEQAKVEDKEEETADLTGMTCGADGDQGHSDIAQSGTPTGTKRETEESVERLSLSGTDPENSLSYRLVDADAQTVETRRTSKDSHAGEHGKVRGEGRVSDSEVLRDGEVASNDLRLQTLSQPPVVTYGTYRGQREQRRMRRRHQVASPILEGDESQQGRGSGEGSPASMPFSGHQQGGETPSTLELSPSYPNDSQTLLTNLSTAPASETNNREAWTLETNSAALGPTGPCHSFSDIPVLTQISGCSVASQSAFSSSKEGDSTAREGHSTYSLSGVKSFRDSPPELWVAPTAGKISVSVSESPSVEQNPEMEVGEDTGRDIDKALPEHTGTSPALSAQTGSPSTVAELLSEPGGAGGTANTHLSAAVVSDSQLAPHRISTSGSLAEDSGIPIPTAMVPDSGAVLDASSNAEVKPSAWREVEGGVGTPDRGLSGDQDSYEEALRLESKIMVDNILRNALIAMEGIQSSEFKAETLQSTCEESKCALPEESVEYFGHSFEPDKLPGASLSEDGRDTCSSAAPTEQALSSSQVKVEGIRSTPSSGYESIAGSDTDIRSSPGPTWDRISTIGSTLKVLDEMHGERCSEGTTVIGHLAEVKGQQLMDVSKLSVVDGASHPDDNREEGKLGPMSSQCPHRDGGISPIARASNEYKQCKSISGTTNENKGQVVCSARDSDNNKVEHIGNPKVGDLLIGVAKDDRESNTCYNQINTEYDVTLPNNLEYPYKLAGSLNNNASLIEPSGRQTASLDLPVTVSNCQIQNIDGPNHVTVKSKQVSEARHTIGKDVTDIDDKAQNSGAGIKVLSLQKVPFTEDNRLNDNEDQSFVLVETYLAAVIEDCSDSGGEEDGACRPGSSVTMNPTSSQRSPEDLVSFEVLASMSAPGFSNGDRPQWSTVRATRYDISAELELCDSETQGHSASVAAGGGPGGMAGSHSDLSSRLSGLHTWTGRRGGHLPDLTACAVRAQALGPLPLLDLHEVEAGGFAIIDEEEETDAVFVNNTGPMLSPTSRRAKAYPFSLSPIVEEDSVREEAGEGRLSREDRDLLVPPATEEELRSLSGGGGVEQQASASSLSILSLLQSVSERLQSSALPDKNPDGSSSPPSQLPLWECFFNRDQGEEDGVMEDGKHQAVDEDQRFPLYPPCNRQEVLDKRMFGSFSSVDGLATGCEEKADLFSHQLSVQRPADTPFYKYLKSAASIPLEYNEADHEATQVKKNSERCTSSKTDEEENLRFLNTTPRPTLMYIYEGTSFSGEKKEIHADLENAGIQFPNGASVRVLGGCWLLYLEPGFTGPGVVLEEGETVLTHQPGQHTTQDKPTAITIGSIRRLVKDDNTPEIHLSRPGTSAQDTECLFSQTNILVTHIPVHPSNLRVQSGCWLAYDSPGCHGNYVVMEAGGLSTPGPGQSKVTSVRSLRPLRRGGLKVRRPFDPKGRGRELLGHTPLLGTATGLNGVASLRVIGGVWVGYTGEGYTGRQYLLEEGEYADCQELCGADPPLLLSFRFLQADFIEPSLSLLEETVPPPRADKTKILDLNIPDLEKAGATDKTTSIYVNNGVWVAYSERGYRGEQCVLEKGRHPSTLDFSSGNRQPAKSVQPVRLDFGGTGELTPLLAVYSQPQFEGEAKEYEGEVMNCGANTPRSLRVIRGSWLLFEDEGFCGNQYVLGEGIYPDLISCGCLTTSVKSLRPIPYNFSEPSLSLFSLDSYEGVKTAVVTPLDSMKDIFTQSLRVDSGTWVAYEYAHYQGRQMLLQPGQVPRWGDHSSWDSICSVRPLRQPRVYVQLRSRCEGSVLTAEDVQGDSSPARVSLSPAYCLDTQRWLLTCGLLRCKAGKGCLSVIGAKAVAGARVAVWPEHGRTHQRWSLNHNGTISSHLHHNLVLDCRGGTGFDKDHLVVNEFSSDQATQYWNIEVV